MLNTEKAANEHITHSLNDLHEELRAEKQKNLNFELEIIKYKAELGISEREREADQQFLRQIRNKMDS